MLWLLALVWGGSVLAQVPSWPVEEEYKLYTSEERAARGRVKKAGIVGGGTVAGWVYPYICSLRIADDNCGNGISGNHFCGGSLIDASTASKRWVLTAAHCFDKPNTTPRQTTIDNYNDNNPGCDFRLTVDVGRTDPGGNSGSWQTLRMQGWKSHASYDATSASMRFDIAMAFTLDSLSNPAPVTLKQNWPCGNCATHHNFRVMGYGLGNPLEELALEWVNWNTCNSQVNAYTTGWDLHVGHLCAYKDTTHRISSGDSGGPIIQVYSLKQTGLVSCAFSSTSMPQFFTDVMYYEDWIDDAKTSTYGCHNSCEIPANYYNDGDYCDCPECEDETGIRCSDCMYGCEETCGDDSYCP